jgi:hypothetical protein
MRRKAPPGGFYHEFLHDVYQTLVSSLRNYQLDNQISPKESGYQETKQDSKFGKKIHYTPKFVVCLVFFLLTTCLAAAAWHNDIAVLLVIAWAVSYAFKRLIRHYVP